MASWKCLTCTRTRVCRNCAPRVDRLRALLLAANVPINDVTYCSGEWRDGGPPILHVDARNPDREVKITMPSDHDWELGIPVRDLIVLGTIASANEARSPPMVKKTEQ